MAFVFKPYPPTVTRTSTTTSARVQLTTPTHDGEFQVRVTNLGSYTAYIAFGDSTVTATVATGIPVLPNTTEAFTVDADKLYLASINDTGGSSTVYATTGRGA